MVSHTTLVTDAWDTAYNHLQTGTYAISTHNIFSAYNDKLVDNKGLPFVVIYPPSVATMAIDLRGNIQKAEIVYTIEIYHNTAENVKALHDEVKNKLVSGYSVFAAAGIKRKRDEWMSSDYDSWSIGNSRRLHRYTLIANYRYV